MSKFLQYLSAGLLQHLAVKAHAESAEAGQCTKTRDAVFSMMFLLRERVRVCVCVTELYSLG